EPLSFAFPWPLYVKLFHSGDAVGLNHQIEQDIMELRSQSGITPSMLRSSVTGLLRLFHSELKFDEQVQSEQHQLHLKELDAIGRITEIWKLVALVQESGKRLLNSLEREKKSPVVAGVLDRI